MPTLDFDGVNILRSNVSAQSARPSDNGRWPFSECVDVIVDGANRLRKRRGKGTAIGNVPSSVANMHEFERVDPVSGNATFYQIVAIGTAIYIWNGTIFVLQTLPITPTAGGTFVFLNFANRCFAVNGKDAAIVFDGTAWKIVGFDAPAAAATYLLSGKITTGTVTVVQGTQPIVGIGTGFVAGGTWINLYIDINGVRYQIQSVTDATHLTLTETFKEAGGTYGYVVYTGLMSWANPPRYSHAFYNPTTGHVTNGGPVVQISEKDIVGQTVTYTIPAAQQNADAFAAGYTQIKIFRPVKDGTAMMAINVTVNNVANNFTPIVYTETINTASDTAVTNLPVPQDLNTKPYPAMTALTSWLGRVWGLRPADPTNTPADSPRTYYTGLPLSEIPFGVSSECWPRRFTIEGVARPIDLLTIGGDSVTKNLLIVGADGNYTTDGYDHSTFTPAFRLPNSRSGGFQLGTIDMDGAIVQMFRDKHLFVDGNDIGLDIQDKLDAITASAIATSRLHAHAYESFRYLFVTIPKGASTPNYSLVIDRDRQRYIEWTLGFTAFKTMHAATGDLELWAGDAAGNVFKLMQAGVFQDAGGNFQPFFTTNPIRTVNRRIYRRVHLFVGPLASNPAALAWQLTYRRDEDPVGTTVNFGLATTGRESANGLELVYTFEQPVICNTFVAKVTFPSSALDLYVERMVIVYDDEQQEISGP